MINWGIVGLGKIAHSFAKDLQLVEAGNLIAVASRSKEKADLFAATYHATSAYGSYEELFKDNEVDIVYIATPHNSHADLSILAMKNGKHVLCEKPIAVNLTQLERMMSCAKENNVFLMEALWTRFNPSINKVLDSIQAGTIGEVMNITADFCFKSEASEESRLHNMDLAGGALLDIGIYPVFLSYCILGMPDDIHADAHFHHSGSDIECSILMKYQHSSSKLSCDLRINSEMVARIYGTDGNIYIGSRWHETEHFEIEKANITCPITYPKLGKGYTYEIQECHDCIKANQMQSKKWTLKNSQDLITILDTIRDKINLKYPFE